MYVNDLLEAELLAALILSAWFLMGKISIPKEDARLVSVHVVSDQVNNAWPRWSGTLSKRQWSVAPMTAWPRPLSTATKLTGSPTPSPPARRMSRPLCGVAPGLGRGGATRAWAAGYSCLVRGDASACRCRQQEKKVRHILCEAAHSVKEKPFVFFFLPCVLNIRSQALRHSATNLPYIKGSRTA